MLVSNVAIRMPGGSLGNAPLAKKTMAGRNTQAAGSPACQPICSNEMRPLRQLPAEHLAIFQGGESRTRVQGPRAAGGGVSFSNVDTTGHMHRPGAADNE